MSGISSGVGLISGINTAQLIDQLMALESRPVTMLQNRSKVIDAQRAAYLALSAQILAVQNAASNFGKLSFFRRFNAKSSDETVLSAIAGEKAAAGSTTLRVHSLVSNHSVASRGFADANRTPVGVGTLSIEVGRGRVDRATDLDELNGGRGVRRGIISITDRSGASTQVDLTKAFTVADVLEAINTDETVRVRASVTGVASNGALGDRVILVDESGGTGNLIVADKEGGFAAHDLGIAANIAGDRIDGADVFYLSDSTLLALLNDGNGVDRFAQGATVDDLSFATSFGSFGVSLTDVLRGATDLRALNGGNGVRLGVIRITDKSGTSADIDLTAAKTAQDVITAINAAGLGISATTVNSSFILTDTTEAAGPDAKKLKIEDVSGFAAADLGIAGEFDLSVRGRDVYRMASLGDLVRAINLAPGNGSLVEASISSDGNGITLRALGFDNTVTVTAGQENGQVSQAAEDLGLLDATFSTTASFTTRPLVGGLNTVLLNSLRGGQGVTAGVVAITDAQGRTAEIDFTSARTLQDVVDLINAQAGISLRAAINEAGNGLALHDDSGEGVVELRDVSGTLAADLNIAGVFDVSSAGDAGSINTGNLQLQYVARSTAVATLNGGRGVGLGVIRITDAAGNAYQINLASNLKTVGQLIDAINHVTPDTLNARINDTGDGIVITDASVGTGLLRIEDRDGGTAAADLRLSGAARTGETFIDGRFEAHIEVGPGDTLDDIAEKLNAMKMGFSAAVINDGGAINPYSLTITSTVSGRRGELVIDAGTLDLGLTTLSRPRDAVISVGQSGSSAAMLITSTSNTMEDVIPGVTVNLLSAGDKDVTVTTEQDLDSIIEAVGSFVEAYNDVQKGIDDATKFNQETLERGPLLGDSTVSQIRSRMHRSMSRSFEGTSAELSRLFSVGLRIGAGNQLIFEEQKFRDAYEKSPELVEKLFTFEDTGFAATLQKSLEDLTADFDGLISRRNDLLADQQEVINERIESMNILLAAKRKRLEAQFAGLETALSNLQGQQNALSELALLASQR